jgi:ADP-glucose pyrophosphorylase
MENETQIVMELKAKSSAFSDYLENGIDFVKKYYPEQLDFVQENKDKSFDEVRKIITEKFNAINKH